MIDDITTGSNARTSIFASLYCLYANEIIGSLTLKIKENNNGILVIKSEREQDLYLEHLFIV